ncbi:hypothetical protein DV737_g3935, partial [Chaetothyriales sp. CBS 132003]
MSYLQDNPPLPPLSTIFPHLEEELHTLPPTIDPFTVTTKNGYLPCQPPLVQLPDDFSALSKILDSMPVKKLDGTPGLLANFALGPLIDGGQLPDLTPYLDRLIRTNDKLNLPLVTALFRDYSFLASSYLLEPCWESWSKDHNQGYGLGRQTLPKCIAGPLVRTAEILDIPPFMSYAASYALYNYYLEDPSLGPSVYSNLRLVRAFEHGLNPKSSEAGFILTHIHMVQETGPLIDGAVSLLKSIEVHPNPTAEDLVVTTSAFQTMLDAMARIEASMESMWTNSLPKDYISYRTFIFGITNQSMFPNGVIYEGENENKPMYFRGESGANDSIIPLLDHILEVPMPKNPLTDILIDFRKYRPRAHREFLAYMMSKAGELGVRKHCTANTDLAQLYLKLLDHVRSFRWRHWLFAREYIIKRSSHPTATGGSPIVTWLPNQLMAVMDAMDQVYKDSGLESMVQKEEKGMAFVKAMMDSMREQRGKLDKEVKKYYSSIEEQHGIILRTFYPPELTNERAKQYATGALERPIETLYRALSDTKEARGGVNVKDCVVHWFRVDTRSVDNKALHLASQKAKSSGVPLVCVYLVSPQDFEAHLTAPVKVDFILRNLEVLKRTLAELDIPLYVEKVDKRKTLPERLMRLCKEWGASHVFCNIEYEVDELRRDAGLTKMLLQEGICFEAVHDSCVVQPGKLTTMAGGQMSVYSPWYRKWITYLNQHPKELDEYAKPGKNPKTAKERYKQLFECHIPEAPNNKRLNKDDKEKLAKMWPAGENEARERLEKFIKTHIANYHEARNIPASNGTSALSPHLAAGTISARTCVRRAKEAAPKKNLTDDRKHGHSMWIGEVAWRDFYKHVLCHWPYICMNKPFKPEYSNIEWEYDAEQFEKWKNGKTGFPIVDAALRQASQTGYMHNRCRMIVASFLAKDLLIDWRMGERWFMEHLIDGDFASNNGGWGFSASCGVDPQPYFRIFNPVLQSISSAEADFLDVRVNLESDRSLRGNAEEKYFQESTFHQHYDGRFASHKLQDDLRLPQLTALMQSFLSTMDDIGAETWIMHGTLLGWWWNGKLLPWDSDIDVQVTEQTMGFLAKFYNMTEYHFTFPDNKDGVTYLLEINPHYVNGTTADTLNVIDARWIDTQTGLFIDISTVRLNHAARAQGIEGALIVKDKHHYLERDLFPLRDGFFEGFHVKIPFDYEWLLVEEYGQKSLTLTTFEGKLTILTALTCTMISGLFFGFSQSLRSAFVTRAMQGLSNGNVGIIRTAVAEIVPERELQPRAFSIMPLVWTVGSIFGPALGGSLVYPVERFPVLFRNSKLFEDYPFALPNILISSLFIVGIICGFLFLRESLESRRHKRDYGILLGQLLTSPCTRRSKRTILGNNSGETDPLIPADGNQLSNSKSQSHQHSQGTRSGPSWDQVFSRQSNINLVVYTFLAAHSIAYDQLLPIFMHHPVQSIDDPAIHLPLKFAGGFGLNSERIGLMFMSIDKQAAEQTAQQGVSPANAPAPKPPDAELLARLKKLEGVVHSLGANVDGNGRLMGSASAIDTTYHDGGGAGGESPDQTSSGKRSSIDRRLGRLIVSDNRSRYVSNQFWASMGDEIADMRDLLDAESTEDEEDSYESPAHDKFNSHQGFIFGYSSLMVDLKALHPTPSQIFILWEIFKDNIDPVVRLLHRPTIKEIFMNAASSVDRISRAAEALLFSLYFGAVVSLTDEQCRKLLNESRDTLQKKYRFATEQALARADFLNSSSLVCLQAFIFFLICVRHMDETRLVWALGGMAVHLAQVLGIHRDGTHFGLTPFDTEMRRRLWWHISILDSRAAEDHGTDPTFNEQFYDTRLPLNVNDEDIYPEMKVAPKEREGTTEMTFCLIRFELVVFNRRLNPTQPGASGGEQTLEEKENMIDACHRRIEDKYLRHCDMSKPIFWVSATVARLILAKMWLMVHHPRSISTTAQGRVLLSETKDRLFIRAVEVIEFAYILQTNENTAKWGWLFQTYMQWQSVAFVLAEICERPPGPDVERAWHAVECVCDPKFSDNPRTAKGLLWKPIRHLMIKARAIHGQQSQRASSTPSHTDTSDGTLAPEQDSWLVNFPHLTVLSASAEALDVDISSLFSPRQESGQSAASGQIPGRAKATADQNTNDTPMASVAMSPCMNQDVLNWNVSTPNVGSFSVEGSEPIMQFFQSVQQEWF